MSPDAQQEGSRPCRPARRRRRARRHAAGDPGRRFSSPAPRHGRPAKPLRVDQPGAAQAPTWSSTHTPQSVWAARPSDLANKRGRCGARKVRNATRSITSGRPPVDTVLSYAIALTYCKPVALRFASLVTASIRNPQRGDSNMSLIERRKPFWKHDAFWFVGMPTVLVGGLFLVALLARAFG